MNKILRWFIIIMVYLASCLYNLNWLRTSYSDKGQFGNIDPDGFDIIITFVPVINSGFTIFFTCTCPYEDCSNFWTNKIFKPKHYEPIEIKDGASLYIFEDGVIIYDSIGSDYMQIDSNYIPKSWRIRNEMAKETP